MLRRLSSPSVPAVQGPWSGFPEGSPAPTPAERLLFGRNIAIPRGDVTSMHKLPSVLTKAGHSVAEQGSSLDF